MAVLLLFLLLFRKIHLEILELELDRGVGGKVDDGVLWSLPEDEFVRVVEGEVLDFMSNTLVYVDEAIGAVDLDQGVLARPE